MPKVSKLIKATHATPCHSYDINTVAGLFEALGGDKAVAREIGVAATEPRRWAISGCIPPGWHLRLYAKSLLLGQTVAPVVWGFAESDEAGLALVHAVVLFRDGGANV